MFAQPATLTLPYDPALLGSMPETDLALASRSGSNDFSGTGWVLIDAAHDTATGYITHFSQWAIVPAPPGNCVVNYGCMKKCTGAQIPDLCCAAGRSTCYSTLNSSFPTYVGCMADCIGTPQVTNFGSSACMAGCCTGHAWTVMPQGACYRADATLGEAEGVLDCARACFAHPDQSTLCGTGDIKFDACRWTWESGGIGGECDNLGSGVNMQFLFTTLRQVSDQTWGSPPEVHVTGGSLSSTSISIAASCATAVSASGMLSGTWTGTQYDGTFSFGTAPNGTFTVRPDWPLD